MATVVGSIADVHPGLHSHAFVRRTIKATSVPNGDNLTGLFPELVGKAAIPANVRAFTYGAGSPGARTLTQVAATLTVVSFDEATGLLTLLNGTGGALTNVVVLVEFIVQEISTPA